MKTNKYTQIDRHHRVPRSAGGTSNPENISSVRRLHHEAYHTLFATGDPHYVAAVLNKTWIDPNFELVVIEKKPLICDHCKRRKGQEYHNSLFPLGWDEGNLKQRITISAFISVV